MVLVINAPMENIEREWSQVELRQHLLNNGFMSFTEDEIIPQGIKYIDFTKSTHEEIDRHIETLRRKRPDLFELVE